MAVRIVCVNALWLLKNSFQGILITRFVRKLLNVRSPQTLKFAEITGLVPYFQQPRPDFVNNRSESGLWILAVRLPGCIKVLWAKRSALEGLAHMTKGGILSFVPLGCTEGAVRPRKGWFSRAISPRSGR